MSLNSSPKSSDTLLRRFALGEKIVLFDGVCRLCNGWAKFLIRQDRQRHFSLRSVQSAEGQAVLRSFGMSTTTFDTMVLVENGHCYVRSTALLRILGHLPGIWKIARLGYLIPQPLRDVVYNTVANNRYRLFGRDESCILPSPDHDRYFLGSGANSEG